MLTRPRGAKAQSKSLPKFDRVASEAPAIMTEKLVNSLENVKFSYLPLLKLYKLQLRSTNDNLTNSKIIDKFTQSASAVHRIK